MSAVLPDMTPPSDLRHPVLAQIGEAMVGATGALDAIRRAQARYPGTPSSVCLEAWSAISRERTEQWWTSLERTIDGEVIRNALANQDCGQ